MQRSAEYFHKRIIQTQRNKSNCEESTYSPHLPCPCPQESPPPRQLPGQPTYKQEKKNPHCMLLELRNSIHVYSCPCETEARDTGKVNLAGQGKLSS